MITLYDRFPKNKGSEKYGKNYIILEDRDVGADHKFPIKCTICMAETYTSPYKIFIGQKPCKCGMQYYSTPERKLEKIKEICKVKNTSVEDNLVVGSSKEKFTVTCNVCQHSWRVTFPYFCYRDRGCPSCADQKRYTDDEYIERVNQVGIFKNLIFKRKVNQDKLRIDSKVVLECLHCSSEWESMLTNIIHGKYTCPNCARRGFNPCRPAHLYILKVEDSDDSVVCYKYGISNIIDRRLENLNIYNKDFNIEHLCSWFYRDGRLAKEHENLLHKKFGSFMSKSDMVDGYTETISPDKLYELFKYQSELYLSDHGGVSSGGSSTDPFNA